METRKGGSGDDDDDASGGGDDDHRHYDETQGDDEHTDGAQSGRTSKCVRSYARSMLAVWAVGGAPTAGCLVIRVAPASRSPRKPDRIITETPLV